jgi:hypothetical protein
VALSVSVIYIQSSGSGIGIFSGLFHVTLISQSIETFFFIVGALILMPWSLTTAPQIKSMVYLNVTMNLIRSRLFLVLATIVLLYVVYTQTIGSGIGIFSGLFHDFLSAQYCAVDEIVPSTVLCSALPLVKPRRWLTKAEKEQFVLTQDLKSILVGLYLGDLHARKLKGSVNPRLEFEQGTIHEDYLLHLYELFKDFCPSSPQIRNLLPHPKTGKVYSTIRFNTRALPCFKEFYDLFYPRGVKIIPANIGELFTPLSLAYLIADDGSFNTRYPAVILSTQSFSLKDVNLLAKILNDNLKLNCTINKSRSNFVIRISPESLPILQALLAPIMPSSMRYKIGL